MKEKLALLIISAACAISCVTVAGLTIKDSVNDHPAIIKAELEPYTLTIDSPLYTGEGTSGESITTVRTARGTDIKIKYNKLSPFEAGPEGVTSGFNTMNDGSYIEILSNDIIHGLAGLSNIKLYATIKENGYLKVKYAWDEGVYVNYKEIIFSSNDDDPTYDISLPNSPSYVKIEVSGNSFTRVGLGSIVFTYSCSETENPYELKDDFYLNKVNDHYEVVSYVGNSTTLNVPGTCKDLSVTAIADGFRTVAYDVEDIEEVVLPSSVTKIGYEAFYCKPNDTSKLDRINLINVTHIAARAFLNNCNLGKSAGVDLRNASFIGASAFSTTYLVNETISFYYASSLEIQSTAFRLSGIRTVNFLPNTSMSVRFGTQAFLQCSRLVSVTLPKNTTYLGSSLFSNTPLLTTISYNGTIAEFNAIEKALYWENGGSFTKVQCSDGDIPFTR